MHLVPSSFALEESEIESEREREREREKERERDDVLVTIFALSFSFLSSSLSSSFLFFVLVLAIPCESFPVLFVCEGPSLRGFWGALEGFLGLVGSLWRPPERLVGASGGFLGPSCCHSRFPSTAESRFGVFGGASWGHLGPSWGFLGAILGPIGPSWGSLGSS